MKNYKKFLEASINDNPGVPGQYKSRIEGEETRRLGVTTGNRGQEMQAGMQLSQDFGRSQQICAGKEKELSDLATNLITSIYRDLIERYEIELDIKLVKPGEVKKFMDEESEDQDEMPQFRKVVDEDIKNEIHKRKIANLITQGKAKGIKSLLDSQIVTEGVSEIFGRGGADLVNIWKRMADNADKLDWIVNLDTRSEMMEMNPDGLAGASKVDWKPKEYAQAEEDEDDSEYTEEQDVESMYDYEENFSKVPVVKAVGIDFPMLLHEAVKGIYELLSVPGLPEDEKVSSIVLMNTGLSDEPEDWRYGPRIAKDITEFLNENEKIDDYGNLREEFFKHLLNRDTMPVSEFLELIKGILTKTPAARKKVDELLDEIIEDLNYDEDGEEKYRLEMEEYERKMKEWEESKKSGKSPEKPNEIEEIRRKSDEKRASQLSIDDILDKISASGMSSLTQAEKDFLKNNS